MSRLSGPRPIPETLQVALVHGDPRFLARLAGALEVLGMRVAAFGTPIELLARYRPGAWDALATDHEVPARSGIALLRELRLRGFDGGAVLLAGAGTEAFVTSALHAGFADCIVARAGRRRRAQEAAIVRSIRGAALSARLERENRRQRAESERLAWVARSLSDALLVIDQAGKVTFSSPLARDLLGADGLPLVGRSLFDLVDFGPDAELSRAMLDEARLGCWRGVGTHGRKRPVLVTLSPLDTDIDTDGESDRSVSGEFACLVVDASVCKDRSVQREHALATTLVMRRLESASALAARLAHEVNNPSTWLMLNLETLGGELRATVEDPSAPSPSSEAILRRWLALVDACLVGVDRITSYTGRLLRLTRDEACCVRLVRPVDCVRSALTLLGRDETQAQIIDLLPERATVAVEDAALSQAVAALLENAYDAVGASSRGDDGPDASSRVCIVLRAEGLSVEIAVKDAGCGLPPGSEERLFEPFFTTKANRGGTGLGLTMARSVARRFGGSLRVSSLAPGEAFNTVGVIGLPTSGEREASAAGTPATPS